MSNSSTSIDSRSFGTTSGSRSQVSGRPRTGSLGSGNGVRGVESGGGAVGRPRAGSLGERSVGSMDSSSGSMGRRSVVPSWSAHSLFGSLRVAEPASSGSGYSTPDGTVAADQDVAATDSDAVIASYDMKVYQLNVMGSATICAGLGSALIVFFSDLASNETIYYALALIFMIVGIMVLGASGVVQYRAGRLCSGSQGVDV